MKTKYVDLLAIFLASLFGLGSLLLFVCFLFAGSLRLTDLRLSSTADLWLDAGLCLCFFFQHSGMIRLSFRNRLARIVPPRYDGAVYAIASGVVLFALMILWQASSHTVVRVDGVPRMVVRSVFFLAIGGAGWGLLALGQFDPSVYDRFSSTCGAEN